MDVLVAVGSLSGVGGSESYSYALIQELIRRGYNVDTFAYSREDGSCLLTEEKLIEQNIPFYHPTLPSKTYDLVLSSQHTTLYNIDSAKGFRIHTLHGSYVEEEQPLDMADYFVSITKEVYDHAKSLGFNSTIIGNGINTERFKPITKINKQLKKVLSLSHNSNLNERLRNIFDRLGIEFIYHQKHHNPVFNVEDKINEVDLVITIGRGVYEAMSCGRVVFILDDRGYIDKGSIGDGIVTDKNIDYFIQNNCSGRYTNKVFTDDDIIEELSKYDYRLGDFGRQYIKDNLTIEQSVDKYLQLYEQFR